MISQRGNISPDCLLHELEDELLRLTAMVRTLKDRWSQMAQSAQAVAATKVQRSDLCAIIENGRKRYAPFEEVAELRKAPQADFILDLEQRLWVMRPRGRRAGGGAWVPVSWPLYKILHVGMRQPGRPFGNLRINDEFEDCSPINARTLTRDICVLAALIQGGGTKGPYLRSANVLEEVSFTKHGYVFEEQWNYVVLSEKA